MATGDTKVFSSYSDIENSYREKFIDRIKQEKKDIGKWVITEKIHGSNTGFCINLNTKETYFISRNQFIENTKVVDIVFGRINPNIDNIISAAKKYVSDINSYKILIIYGELFGGSYNHPDVPKDNNATKIQKGIFYAPFNDFRAFDIALIKDRPEKDVKILKERINEAQKKLNESTDETEKNNIKNTIKSYEGKINSPLSTYVDFDTFNNILKDSNIKSVPILAVVDSFADVANLFFDFKFVNHTDSLKIYVVILFYSSSHPK